MPNRLASEILISQFKRGIEEIGIIPLVDTFNDVTNPIAIRVNCFRRINEIYKLRDKVLKSKLDLSNVEERNKINDKLYAIIEDNEHTEFTSEEKQLFDDLEKDPTIKLNGGKRKRSIGKRSIGKRSIGKRSIGKRSMKRRRSIGKRSMKRSMKRRRSIGKRSIKRGAYSPNGIVATLTEMLHVVKLHHWRTHDYSVHKATDNLHEALSEQVDSFVEKLLGSKHTRSNLTSLRMRSYNTLPALKQRVEYYKRYLRGMPASLGTDLLNIRDELLGSLNQFSYMLSLH
jgi:hypothetical protein